MSDERRVIIPSYSGRGWKLVSWSNLQNAPEWFAAPASVAGGLLVTSLVGWLLIRGYLALASGSADDVYKILLTLAGAIGAPFVAWRTLVAHQQTGILRETHFTTLFTKAVEQLGATREVIGESNVGVAQAPAQTPARSSNRTEPNLEVRLGAIYALERIAQDSIRDHWPIMEVLCAYIRNPQNCGSPVNRPSNAEDAAHWHYRIQRPRVDIQAALSVIGRRAVERVDYETQRGFKLDLSGANLQRANLDGNFESAALSGANLAGATVTNCTIKLWGALRSIDGLNIRRSRMLQLVIRHRDPRIVDLSISSSTLSDIWLINKTLEGCFFFGSEMVGAGFKETRFVDTHFHQCNLKGARFDRAKFADCFIGECRLDNASFYECDLSAVTGLTTETLSIARGDATTILPNGVGRPDSWPVGELSNEERDALYGEIPF